MRFLIRMLLTWAVLLPLGYFVGLPYAATKLTAKTQNETLTQCAAQLRDKGVMGGTNAAITEAQGDAYCHCLASPLTLTTADIMEMVKQRLATGEQKPPARLEAQVNSQVEACNPQLQEAIMAKYRSSAAPAAAPAQGQTIIIQ